MRTILLSFTFVISPLIGHLVSYCFLFFCWFPYSHCAGIDQCIMALHTFYGINFPFMPFIVSRIWRGLKLRISTAYLGKKYILEDFRKILLPWVSIKIVCSWGFIKASYPWGSLFSNPTILVHIHISHKETILRAWMASKIADHHHTLCMS